MLTITYRIMFSTLEEGGVGTHNIEKPKLKYSQKWRITKFYLLVFIKCNLNVYGLLNFSCF